MLGTTPESVYRSKIGFDEVVETILSVESFEGDMYDKIEGEGPGEGDPRSIS